MRKIIIGILETFGVVLLCIGINIKVKGQASVSIIGGADGPTSIFLAGKVGTDFSLVAIVAGIIVCVIGVILAFCWYKRRS